MGRSTAAHNHAVADAALAKASSHRSKRARPSHIIAKHASSSDLQSQLGIVVGDKCPTEGAKANIGCALGCKCRWAHQCYHKMRPSEDNPGQPDDLADVGECSLSMTALVVGSVGIFLGVLLVIVVARLALMGSCCGGGDEFPDEEPNRPVLQVLGRQGLLQTSPFSSPHSP